MKNNDFLTTILNHMFEYDKPTFFFLSKDQIFGENKLDIIKNYGTKCVITDFSILLGGIKIVSESDFVNDGKCLENRYGKWWTKTISQYCDVVIVGTDGKLYEENPASRNVGARPAIDLNFIPKYVRREIKNVNGNKEVDYKEFPQTIVDINLSYKLEKMYNTNNLETTGKYYTTDSAISWLDIGTSFKTRTFKEYRYKGNKYIRLVSDCFNCYGKVLSDGRKVVANQTYWIKVEPITWLIDEVANIALSKKIIFSGIQFLHHNPFKYRNMYFSETDIKKYIDSYFLEEINPIEKKSKSKIKKLLK